MSDWTSPDPELAKETSDAGVLFTPLASADIAPVLDLMSQLRFTVRSHSSRAFYRDLCLDAVENRGVVVCLVKVDGNLAGYAVAIIDYWRYWRTFLIRHPREGTLVLAKSVWWALARRRHRSSPSCRPETVSALRQAAGESASGRNWRQSSQSIAKVVFAGITAAHRGRGLGVGLQRCLFRELARHGVRRVDAWVPTSNLQAIRMDVKVGYRFEFVNGEFFLTLDLDERGNVGRGPCC